MESVVDLLVHVAPLLVELLLVLGANDGCIVERLEHVMMVLLVLVVVLRSLRLLF
jgi:hypothetical protein